MAERNGTHERSRTGEAVARELALNIDHRLEACPRNVRLMRLDDDPTVVGELDPMHARDARA
jgi:hypothetical protein